MKRFAGIAACALLLECLAPAQSWQPMANPGPPEAGLNLLLTDGTVIVHVPSSREWWMLKPNTFGDYVHGTWTQIASLPAGYGPLYYASAVLADGRVVISGGEYNFGAGVWTNKGAVYDPVANVWSNLNPPSGWSIVGDTQCVVMPDGRFVMAQLADTRMAALNPSTMQWSPIASSGHLGHFNEEGWTLMPDGTIFTVDCAAAPNAEKYVPAQGRWFSAGTTPQLLVDVDSLEMGPQVLMNNGKVVCFGATGHNAVWTPGATSTSPGTWSSAPDFPSVNGLPLAIADGPAILLTNGRVLCGASPGVFNAGTKFFEYDGTSLIPVPGTPNSSSNPCFVGNMLMLPNGQVMYTDFSGDIQVYTSSGGPQAGWRPTITNPPTTIFAGTTFQLFGTQFNGLSQCSSYGDDSANSTNYPLVRLTSMATGHVTYCKTFNHSTMAVATGAATVSTFVKVPSNAEEGLSKLEVVANGIASNPAMVAVSLFNFPPTGVSMFEGAGSSGGLSQVLASDNSYFTVTSATIRGLGETASAEVDFNMPSGSLSQLNFAVESSAPKGVSILGFVYDWTTQQWVNLGAFPQAPADHTTTFAVTGQISRYINASNQMRFVVRNVISKQRTGSGPYQFKLDYAKIGTS